MGVAGASFSTRGLYSSEKQLLSFRTGQSELRAYSNTAIEKDAVAALTKASIVGPPSSPEPVSFLQMNF